MQGFSKILKNNDTIPEYGYGIVTPNSLIVFNGQIGCRYTPRVTLLTDLAQKHGTFAIPDMKNFLAKQKVLDDIQKLTIRENVESLEIVFGGNNKVSFPVILNISSEFPHTAIPWVDYADNKDFIPVTESFREMASLLTNEGLMLWQDDIGITIDGEKMISFDLGVFLTSTLSGNSEKVFVPKRMLDVDMKALSRIAKVDGGIIVYNEEVQFFTSIMNDGTVPDQVLELTDRFAAGDQKKISFSFAKTLWRRIDAFSLGQLNLSIKNNVIFASAGTWREELGNIDAEDCNFSVSASLMKRWMHGCINHAISIDEDGNWLLRGDLRKGGTFYGTATLSGAGASPFADGDTAFDIMGDGTTAPADDSSEDYDFSGEESEDISGGLI